MSKKVAIVQILRAPSGGIRKHVYDIIESQSDHDIQQVFITNTKDKDREFPAIKKLNVHHVEISDQPEMKDIINLFKLAIKLIEDPNVVVVTCCNSPCL